MIAPTSLPDFLVDLLVDPDCGWSIGTFGAIAEFSRSESEPVEIDCTGGVVQAVTARGALRIDASAAVYPIASESLTPQSWAQRVALCLPEEQCAMNRRTALTELGPDVEALRAEDRTSVLFDLGLGALQVDACIRTSNAAVVAALRGYVGQSLFGEGLGAMGVILAAHPHRVFVSRVGRIEVFQPIPPPDGKSPEGPHTHVLPKLLRSGRTHAATEPLPAGWIPCAHFYPPHPMRDRFGHLRPFEPERLAACQRLLARYGDPQLVEIKRRVVESVAAGQRPSGVSLASDRFARAAVRVALRQLKASDRMSPVLAEWLSVYDHFDLMEAEDSSEAHH